MTREQEKQLAFELAEARKAIRKLEQKWLKAREELAEIEQKAAGCWWSTRRWVPEEKLINYGLALDVLATMLDKAINPAAAEKARAMKREISAMLSAAPATKRRACPACLAQKDSK